MLDIGFRIRWVPNSGDGVRLMDDDDFIRGLRETLARRAETQEEQVKKENREFAQIVAKAPDDWKKLKAWLREKTGQLPQEQITYEEELDSIEIKYRGGLHTRTTGIIFRHVDHVITSFEVRARGWPTDEDFTFECDIQDNKLSWFHTTNPNIRPDIAGIGKTILTEATKG
jgi:hypothetical protein